MSARRNTMQREIILNTVRSMHDHPSADAVYKKIEAEHPTISRATVYRNLGMLSARGEIRKVRLPGADSFDFNTVPHYHIVCVECGAAADAGLEFMEGLEGKLTDTGGYEVYGHDIIFKGLCPECREKRRKAEES